MKQIISTAILIFVFCFATFAQDGNFEPLDRYGKVSSNEEKARIGSLFASLSKEKTYEFVIILELNKKVSANKKIKRLKEIIKWAEFNKFDIKRITFMVSEKDSEHTTLLALDKNSKFFKDLSNDYKVIKAEEFEQEIKNLFPKK